MLAPTKNCLTRDEIQRFLQGNLPACEFESASEHLDQCHECHPMGATQHPMGALFVVHGCLLPLLMLVQRFEVTSEVRGKRICVRVSVLIGIGYLFLRLSFPRLRCLGPLSLSAAMTAATPVALHASSV